MVEVIGTVDRQPAGARRRRGDRAGRRGADRRRPHTPPVELWRPTLTPACRPCSTTPRSPGGTRAGGPRGSSRRPACAASATTLDAARLHRGAHPQARRLGHRERRERLRGRLLRPAGVPRPEPAVLQAGAGRGLRAGLRGRAGVPGRAARHRAPPRGVRLASTSSSASSRTTATCIAVLRDVVAGHGRGGARARRPRRSSCSASTCPWCRRSSRSLHFREALEIAGAPADEPDLAPAHERALGEWAQARARQRLRRRRGLPDREPGVLQPPGPGGPALVAVVRPDLPRRRAGQRRAAAAPVRRLRRDARGPRLRPGAVRVVRRGVPARHAAARRLRDRAGALGGPARRARPTSAR